MEDNAGRAQSLEVRALGRIGELKERIRAAASGPQPGRHRGLAVRERIEAEAEKLDPLLGRRDRRGGREKERKAESRFHLRHL